MEFLPGNGDSRREHERPWADGRAGTTRRHSRLSWLLGIKSAATMATAAVEPASA